MKLYVDENDHAVARDAVAGAVVVATSIMAYVEARAAFMRKRIEGGLAPDGLRRIVRNVDHDWDRFMRLDVTEPLLREAARLAEDHRLRGCDAVHLASARLLRHRIGDAVVFASWDSQLETAAAREGFQPLRARRR